MSPVPAVAAGERRHQVTLEQPAVVGLDGHGGYTTTWVPLTPATAFAAIAPATEVQQERELGGTIVATATTVLHLPYHPQITVKTRLTLDGRTLQVLSRRDADERHVELILVCAEVVP